jgi:hypothetical protein
LFVACIALFVKIANKVRYHLGISVADEGDALALKPGFQCRVVFDDSVVNYGYFAGVIFMGMGIYLVWSAVSSPAGMPKAKCLVWLGLVENCLKSSYPAACLLYLNNAVA